jgi:hypothetical protein
MGPPSIPARGVRTPRFWTVSSSYDDHSKNALWLGTPVPMKLDILRPTYSPALLPGGADAA